MAALDAVLDRSEALDSAVYGILDPDTYELADASERLILALAACEIGVEHGRALRTLVRAGLMTSGTSLLRLQGESVVRGMWLLYAASDSQVAKLAQPLSPESEKIANRLPSFSEMIAGLQGKAPPGACEMAARFKDMQAPSLNSYVHSGIHPLSRHAMGYPEPLLTQVVCTSNALVTMAGMVMAVISGDQSRAKRMGGIQPEFADCLPPLLPPQ